MARLNVRCEQEKTSGGGLKYALLLGRDHVKYVTVNAERVLGFEQEVVHIKGRGKNPAFQTARRLHGVAASSSREETSHEINAPAQLTCSASARQGGGEKQLGLQQPCELVVQHVQEAALPVGTEQMVAASAGLQLHRSGSKQDAAPNLPSSSKDSEVGAATARASPAELSAGEHAALNPCPLSKAEVLAQPESVMRSGSHAGSPRKHHTSQSVQPASLKGTGNGSATPPASTHTGTPPSLTGRKGPGAEAATLKAGGSGTKAQRDVTPLRSPNQQEGPKRDVKRQRVSPVDRPGSGRLAEASPVAPGDDKQLHEHSRLTKQLGEDHPSDGQLNERNAVDAAAPGRGGLPKNGMDHGSAMRAKSGGQAKHPVRHERTLSDASPSGQDGGASPKGPASITDVADTPESAPRGTDATEPADEGRHKLKLKIRIGGSTLSPNSSPGESQLLGSGSLGEKALASGPSKGVTNPLPVTDVARQASGHKGVYIPPSNQGRSLAARVVGSKQLARVKSGPESLRGGEGEHLAEGSKDSKPVVDVHVDDAQMGNTFVAKTEDLGPKGETEVVAEAHGTKRKRDPTSVAEDGKEEPPDDEPPEKRQEMLPDSDDSEDDSGSEHDEEEEGDEDEERDGKAPERGNDYICAECDDGGNLLMCDGECLRSFHHGKAPRDDDDEEGGGNEAADAAFCNPLVVPSDLMAEFQGSLEPFQCPNCLAHRHQCFKCKVEGASDQLLPLEKREVFKCVVSTCGLFYHAKCLGESKKDMLNYICPQHRCRTCKVRVDPVKGPPIGCRRCSQAYHGACLPADMVREKDKRVWFSNNDLAWADGLMEGREGQVEKSILYCMKHPIPDWRDLPVHRRPIIDPELLRAWRLHYAQRYPNLASSRAVLQAERERMRALRQQPEAEVSEEDVPLGNRIRLTRKVPRAAKAPLGTPISTMDIDTPARTAAKAPPTVASKLAAPSGGQTPGLTLKTPAPAVAATPAPEQPRPQPAFKTPAAAVVSAGLSAPEQPSTAALTPIPEVAPPPAVEAAKTPAMAAPQPEAAEAAPAEPEVEIDLAAAEAAVPEAEALVQPEEEGQEEEEEEENGVVDLSRVMQLLEAARQRVRFEDVSREIEKPKNYSHNCQRGISWDRWEALKRSVDFAEQHPELERMTLDDQTVRALFHQHDTMRITMAPFLHAKRYTSYGRHFTKRHILEALGSFLRDLLHEGDIVVDFSAGANEYAPLMAEMAAEDGVRVEVRAFDIITAKDLRGFQRKDWFAVTTAELGPSDRLVIGLNPPFGKNSALANQFVDATAAHRPRLIVLVVPPGTKMPPGYDLLHEDRTLLADKVFYVPGMNEDSWNKETPAFRILVRRDLAKQVLFGDEAGYDLVHEERRPPLAAAAAAGQLPPGFGSGGLHHMHGPGGHDLHMLPGFNAPMNMTLGHGGGSGAMPNGFPHANGYHNQQVERIVHFDSGYVEPVMMPAPHMDPWGGGHGGMVPDHNPAQHLPANGFYEPGYDAGYEPGYQREVEYEDHHAPAHHMQAPHMHGRRAPLFAPGHEPRY